MTLPRGLLAAGALFWGWQTGNLVAGVALAVLVEAPRWTARRFELDRRELARIADLCTLVFVGLTAVLAATHGVSAAVLVAIEWLPAVLAPVLLSQCLSSGGRIPLSALFRYVRKRKERDASTDDPLVDVSGVYLVLCAVAAGIGNTRDLGYYAGAVALAAWALYAVRPRHAPLAAWGAALAIAGGAGYAAQAGLVQLQSFLEEWAVDLQLRGMDADPYRSTTDIGSIGRLKQYDAIVLRVYADPRAGAQRLHRASFTTYAGTTWHARKARMAPLEPEADGATWTLAPGIDTSRTLLVTRLEQGKALLALPPGAVRISSLPAAGVKRNALGAVQADVGGDWGRYVAESAEGIAAYALPDADDLEVPPVERGEFERLAAELGLSGVPRDRSDRARGTPLRLVRLLDVPRVGATSRDHRAGRLSANDAARPLRVLRRRDDPGAPRCGHPGALRDRVLDGRVQRPRAGVRRARAARARLEPRVGGRPVGGRGHDAADVVRRRGESRAGVAGAERSPAVGDVSMVPARGTWRRGGGVCGARAAHRSARVADRPGGAGGERGAGGGGAGGAQLAGKGFGVLCARAGAGGERGAPGAG